MYYEKEQLTKKIIMFACVSLIGFALCKVTSDMSILSAIGTGMLLATVFYLPVKLKPILGLGIIGTILLVCAFCLVGGVLFSRFEILLWLVILFPIADIGYSVYRVLKGANAV